MKEKDINSYRLTSMEEPTDEMLSQIMREAVADAKARAEAAHKKFFKKLKEESVITKRRWSKEFDKPL